MGAGAGASEAAASGAASSESAYAPGCPAVLARAYSAPPPHPDVQNAKIQANRKTHHEPKRPFFLVIPLGTGPGSGDLQYLLAGYVRIAFAR